MKIGDTFWYTVPSYIQLFGTFVVAVLYFMLSKNNRKEYREIGGLLVASVATDVTSFLGFDFFHINMTPVIIIYHLIVFVLLISLYRRKLTWKHKDLLIGITFIVFVAFAIVNYIFFQGIHVYNSYTGALLSGIFVVLSILYFPQLSKDATPDSIVKTPMFWIDTGILIYHGGSFFLFLIEDYLVTVLKNDLITFWMFHHVFWFMFLFMTGYAFILIRAEYDK